MSAPLLAYALKYWLWPYKRQFNADLKRPKATQDHLLTQIIYKLSNTKYGLLFNVDKRDHYAEFSKKVPIVSYDKLKHWIDRQKNHESNILVNEPVTRYTFLHDSKLLPHTKSLEDSFYRLFAIQTANAKPAELDISAVISHYKSHWSGAPSPFPRALLAPGQPFKPEAPLLVKLPQSLHLLPLLSEVFFEFLDRSKNVRRLHELEQDTEYDVIISQKAGLYRYHVGLTVMTSVLFKKTPSFQVLHDSHSSFRQALD